MRPRVAVCLTGETRGINSCVPTLYKNILEPLSAGIFYCFNKHNPEKDNKISVFNNRLIKGRIYEKPDLRKTLVPDSLYSKLDTIWSFHFLMSCVMFNTHLIYHCTVY